MSTTEFIAVVVVALGLTMYGALEITCRHQERASARAYTAAVKAAYPVSR